MREKRIGIIMNGVTGRMGTNQHLMRSILAISKQGGVTLGPARASCPTRSWSDATPTSCERARRGARRRAMTTDLDSALADTPTRSSSTPRPRGRAPRLVRKRAIAAGKHVYCEKPPLRHRRPRSTSTRLCTKAGVKHGVVQDKLWLPGLLKLKLKETGLLRQILSVRGEFGYWVFEGDRAPAAAAVVELPQGGRRRHHPRHAVPLALRARQPVRRRCKAVSCLGATHIPERSDESGKKYKAHGRRRRLRDVPARRRRHRPLQLARGTCACGETIC